jgi:hypothetical protein
MRILTMLFACGYLALVGQRAEALDLTKVNRTLINEPRYGTAAPTYCLLVFGEQGKLHVWLVVDGDTLFVDRNGNGDLTEEGERLTAKKEGGSRSWHILELVDPQSKAIYKNLSVWLSEEWSGIRCHADHWGFKDVMIQATFIHFGKRPLDAPIVNFYGPLTLDMWLAEGRGEPQLAARIGCNGLGKGTFATATWSIQLKIHGEVSVEATYPNGKGEKIALPFDG